MGQVIVQQRAAACCVEHPCAGVQVRAAEHEHYHTIPVVRAQPGFIKEINRHSHCARLNVDESVIALYVHSVAQRDLRPHLVKLPKVGVRASGCGLPETK